MTVTPWIGGYPLSTICQYSQVNYGDRWPYGNWEASLQLHVPRGFRHPAIRTDSVVEMRWGKSQWTGRLLEPDWESGQLSATGLIRQGEGYLGINRVEDPPGDFRVQPSVNLEQAIDDAIVGGPTGLLVGGEEIAARVPLSWTRTDPLWSDDLFSVTPDDFSKIFPTLVDLAASRGAGTPYMGGDGRLRFLPTPTVPSWITQPGVVDLGEAGGGDRVTAVLVTFLDSTHSDDVRRKWVTDPRFPPAREDTVDARALGPMTPTEAATIGDAVLGEGLRPVFTSDIQLSPLLATTFSGGPCWPINAKAGQIIRVQGATHPRLSGNHIDVIAGEIAISDAETANPKAVAKPLNRPPQTPAEVIEATLTAARKAAAE